VCVQFRNTNTPAMRNDCRAERVVDCDVVLVWLCMELLAEEHAIAIQQLIFAPCDLSDAHSEMIGQQ
jgi:hypothetical protein